MDGKYRAYSEYKDSGVEWLRKIPEHWHLTRVKHISEILPKKPNIDRTLECSFVPMEKLKTGNIILDETKQIESVYDGYTYFSDNDILMAKVTPCFENKNIAIAKGLINNIGFGSSEIYTIRTNGVINNRFLFYRLQEDGFMDLAKSRMTGAGGLKRVPTETLENYTFAAPEKKEQQQIANFLDHETAKIDTLIKKQQQLITLLKEKRQAVISHAVTKGLNPDVPMRDSGVEWLGEVPAHWDVMNYRYATRIYRGKFGHRPRNDPSFYGGDYPFIQTGDIAQADKKITKYKQTLNDRGISVSQKFPSGTLVMAIAANIGQTAILDFEAYAPDSVVGFKPRAKLDLEFLRYSLMAALPALEQTSTQSAQANLNIDRIGTVKASFPPINEQHFIVEKLDNLLTQYAEIEKKTLSAIELMQERRTALISAAVTGKIDIRN